MDYKIVKYSEIGKIRSGKRLPKGYTVSEKISDNKYIRVRDINSGSIDSSIVQYITDEAAEKLERYKVKTRDVIISVVGTVGAIAQIDESLNGAYLTENCDNLQVDESLCLKDYLKYYLLSEDGSKEIIANTVGSTQPKLPIYGIENFNIKLSSIDNQKRIVKLLNSIDKKIKLNNEINNNLYEICNVLYHQLLDDNELNIEYKTIGEIATKVITGKTPSTKNKEYWGGNIPFITIPDMHNQVFTINTERYIKKEGAKSLIPKNSISVSCIATVGLVSINDKDSQTNQQINSIVIENDYDLYYLFEFLTEQEQYMKSIAGGSTTYNINKKTFENIQVPYLNKGLIIEYDKKVRPMFEKIKSNQISNDTLSQLRDALLPKLMNGEIDLDNIEI